MKAQAPAGLTPGLTTAGAPCWPRGGNCRELGSPLLDADPDMYDSELAPSSSQGWSEHDGEGVPALTPSPFWGRPLAELRLCGRLYLTRDERHRTRQARALGLRPAPKASPSLHGVAGCAVNYLAR